MGNFSRIAFHFVSSKKVFTFSHSYFQRVYVYWENILITNLEHNLLTTPRRTQMIY